MSSFIIKNPLIDLELKLVEIDKLHIHEEIIPDSVNKLSKAIEKDTSVMHPVLVDKKTLVVLDGMHRVWSLKHLGYKLIPVCLLDYNNPNIIIKSWFRTIEHEKKTSSDLKTDLEKLGYKLQKTTDDVMQKKINEKKYIVGIVTSDKSYGIPGKTGSTKETYEYIKKLEENLHSIGYTIGYETGDDAINKTKTGKVLAAITAPQITKKDVVDVALAGEVFVHKSTRHVIPARPLFVNVPLKWLNMKADDANKLLVEYLSKRKLKHLPAGQILDRRYEEELYVFE